jgi:hypothetical protein
MKFFINLALGLSILVNILVLGTKSFKNDPARREQQIARYREEDAHATQQQAAYDRNQKLLIQLWEDKCPKGKDPAIPICADGPPTYIPITYFWGHQLELQK